MTTITEKQAKREKLSFTDPRSELDECIWREARKRDVYLYGEKGQMSKCADCDGYDVRCKAYKSFRDVNFEQEQNIRDGR